MKLTDSSPIQDSMVFALFATGLILMVGVMHFQTDINSFWSPETVPAASGRYAQAQSTPTSLSSYDAAEIERVLIQPENFYMPEDRPTPAQVILNGQGTRFLVGL